MFRAVAIKKKNKKTKKKKEAASLYRWGFFDMKQIQFKAEKFMV